MNALPNPHHEPWTPNQLWAAIMLALTAATCTSILAHRPVRAGGLDGHVLRRALRHSTLPPAESYILITPTMLDSISEAGPLTSLNPHHDDQWP